MVIALWLTLIVAMGVAMAVVLWRPPADSMGAPLEIGLLLTAMPVIALHTERIHFSMVFVPAAALLAYLVQRTPPHATLVRAALIVNAAVATCLPLVLGSRRARLAYQAFSLHPRHDRAARCPDDCDAHDETGPRA